MIYKMRKVVLEPESGYLVDNLNFYHFDMTYDKKPGKTFTNLEQNSEIRFKIDAMLLN